MKPTKPYGMISLVIAAGVFSFTLASTLISRGIALPVAPPSLTISVVAIALFLVALGIPMLRYRSALKDPKRVAKRLAPLMAFRVVVIAKSSSIAAALLLGWHIGLVVVELTLPVIPDSLIESILGALGAAALMAAALWLEFIYRIPPDIDEPVEGSPA